MVENNIPKHWQIKKLRDVCKDLQSGKRPKGGVQGIATGIPSIGAEHLNYNGGFKFEKIKFVPQDFATKMSKGIISKNDIIVVKDGATTGKTSFVGNDFPFEHAVINEHVFILRLKEEVLPKFAFYKLFSATGNKEILEDFRGAAQGGISSGFLDKVNIPLLPLPEQNSIVSKIEELLSDLENGKQQLLLAQQQLKVYRQSLLKWAFEGRLTNKNVNSGIPKGWKLVKVSEVAESMKNGLYKPSNIYSNDGVACLRMYNIYDGKILWFDIKRMNLNKNDIEDYGLKEGDLLVNRVNSRELVGKTAYIKKYEEPIVYESKNIRLRLKGNIVGKYLNYWFLLSANKYFTSNAQQTVGMASINQTQLSNFIFPLCSIEEQQLIVQELESKLTLCDKIEETISQSLQQSETLRQSILKMAFEGKLVVMNE